MFDIVGGLIEALSSYILGRHQFKKNTAFQLSSIFTSIICGLIFFIGYGLYELINPAPNPKFDTWKFLALLSISISFFAYFTLVIDHLIRERRGRSGVDKSN